MQFSDTLRTILLDVVSIVAILGGGSVVRLAQASGSTWQHILPRLMPAPQAFIKDVREERLPTERGTVVGVYNGRPASEPNFFAALLHPGKLTPNQVELVEVREKNLKGSASGRNVYRAKEFGPVFALSLLGLILSGLIAWLSFRHADEFALGATILLSLSSTVVGLASWWKLDLKQKGPRKGREHQVPEGDVVIHYARLGAFRVVKCDEKISELYFRIESCDYILKETAYRFSGLIATLLLMSGLVCLRNSKPELQIAFAGSYALLNILYWICSALDPTEWHWSHDYEVTPKKWLASNSFGDVMEAAMPASTPVTDDNQIEAQRLTKRRTWSFPFVQKSPTEGPNVQVQPPPEYTDALWTAIALVGHSRWVQQARVAPDTGPWRQWIEEAGNIAATWQAFKVDEQPQHESAEASRVYQELLTAVIDPTGAVKLPAWDYQQRFNDLLRSQPAFEKRAPNWPELRALRNAGYFPKTKAEAQPLGILGMSMAQGSDPLPETASHTRQAQGASTGVDSARPESLQPSSGGTHLSVAGPRHRRARSQDDPQRVSVAEASPTEAIMTTEQYAPVDKAKET